MNIGDKVVCVDDGPCVNCGHPNLWIKKDAVYVIRNIRRVGETVVLDLVGVNSPACHEDFGMGFGVRRFRRLEELKKQASVPGYGSQSDCEHIQPRFVGVGEAGAIPAPGPLSANL
jgi:hypothetical protein